MTVHQQLSREKENNLIDDGLHNRTEEAKEKLVSQFQMFAKGEWIALLRASATSDEQVAKARHRKCHRDGVHVERRIMRVGRLVELGELIVFRKVRHWRELRWPQVIRQRWTSCRMSVVI